MYNRTIEDRSYESRAAAYYVSFTAKAIPRLTKNTVSTMMGHSGRFGGSGGALSCRVAEIGRPAVADEDGWPGAERTASSAAYASRASEKRADGSRTTERPNQPSKPGGRSPSHRSSRARSDGAAMAPPMSSSARSAIEAR